MTRELSRRDALKALAAATGAVALSSIPNKWVTPLVEVGALPAHAQGLSGGLRITQFRVRTGECYYDATLDFIDPNNVVNGDTIVQGMACSNKSYAMAISQITGPLRRGPGDTSFQLNYTIGVGCCTVNGTVTAQLNASNLLSNIITTTAIACLSGDTMIETPIGAVRVTDLKVGMPVWTLDATGVRTQAVVAQTVRRPVSSGASIVHLALSDGREVMVSAGHPTTDGRTIGDLVVGDVLDGARVVKADTIPYDQPAKYDLLPAGETGSYWANGIPMNSTIEIKEKRRVPALA